MKNEWKVGNNNVRIEDESNVYIYDVTADDDAIIEVRRGDLLDFIAALMCADAVVNAASMTYVRPKWLPRTPPSIYEINASINASRSAAVKAVVES